MTTFSIEIITDLIAHLPFHLSNDDYMHYTHTLLYLIWIR